MRIKDDTISLNIYPHLGEPVTKLHLLTCQADRVLTEEPFFNWKNLIQSCLNISYLFDQI